MHHQSNHSVHWSSQIDLGCLALDSKSLEKLRKSVESQQSQACAGAAHNWCWQILAGNSVLSNSIGLSPGLKQKFLPQKSLQTSEAAAVPCVQGRIFADGDDKKVTWDVLCWALNLGIKYLLASPSLTRPHHCSIHRQPLTHTRRCPKYIEDFFLPSRIWNHQISFYFSSLHLHRSVHHKALDDWSWNTESIKCTQIAVMTISELRTWRSVTEMSPVPAPDDIPAACYHPPLPYIIPQPALISLLLSTGTKARTSEKIRQKYDVFCDQHVVCRRVVGRR